MFTQLPRVLSFIPSSFATTATGRDVSITIFTASSLNSGEKLLFLGRVKIIYLPGIILMDDCPGSSGHLTWVIECGVFCAGSARGQAGISDQLRPGNV